MDRRSATRDPGFEIHRVRGSPVSRRRRLRPSSRRPTWFERYLALLDGEQPRTIVEIAIKEGGSTALIALAADPDLLLAVDLEPEIPKLLAELIETKSLHDRLIIEVGLDQGDRSALTRFVDAHLPAGAFDLVVDDASHLLGPTRTSFEVLFPRLRPAASTSWRIGARTASRRAASRGCSPTASTSRPGSPA